MLRLTDYCKQHSLGSQMTEMIAAADKPLGTLSSTVPEVARKQVVLHIRNQIHSASLNLRDPLRAERLSKQEFGETKPELGTWTRDGECLSANDLGVL